MGVRDCGKAALLFVLLFSLSCSKSTNVLAEEEGQDIVSADLELALKNGVVTANLSVTNSLDFPILTWKDSPRISAFQIFLNSYHVEHQLWPVVDEWKGGEIQYLPPGESVNSEVTLSEQFGLVAGETYIVFYLSASISESPKEIIVSILSNKLRFKIDRNGGLTVEDYP